MLLYVKNISGQKRLQRTSNCRLFRFSGQSQ